MNFQEIKKKLFTEGELTLSEFGYMDYSSEELGLGPVEEVAQRGGEGEGEDWYSVQYFKEHDVYIRIDGYYNSYNGTDFDNDVYEVFPSEKTITVYLPK